MILILEGCDGAGKTYLANALAKRFDLQYQHEGPPPLDVPTLEHYGATLQEAREFKVVFDRLALGERVYGPIYRYHDALGADGWRVFYRLITAAGAFQIMCMPEYEVCHKAWASGRNEMIRDEKMFRHVYDRYKELANNTGQNYIYDWTRDGAFDRLCEHIEVWFSTQMAGLPLGVNGSPYARYMLVGDKGSNPESKTTDLAFFGTTDSSGYLMTALDIAGYTEKEVMYVNANRHDGKKVTWPVPEVIIALGSAASHECKARYLNHRKITHPAYWRRFHPNDVAGYAQILKDVR